MQFQTVQILNYKSFLDSGEITLTAGFNVIVGKNDAGKSALVEALSLQAQSKPHCSQLTMPERWTPTDPHSLTIFSIDLTPGDLGELISRQKQFCFPYNSSEDVQSSINRLKDAISQGGKFIGRWTINAFPQGYLQAYGDYEPVSQWLQVLNTRYPHGIELVYQGLISPPNNTLAMIVASTFASRIYLFRAERLNVGECAVGCSSSLTSNASNLAEVLNVLISSNPKRYERFLSHVRTVFPHITQITVPVTHSNTARVMVWGIPSESERDDLAVPLSESGTGVGQVLAMLYVVVTSDIPKIIIIDEPQSFLHPGAVRKLLEILREYPQHQYVITTHAPTAIAATGVESLIRVRRDEYESFVEPISACDENDLRLFLADVGASLSDVFGADNVLWVEGKTEELCFPVIIRKLNKAPLLGLQILAVQSTGDLEGKLASRVFDVYNRLTSANTLLPPAIAFILDREGKSDREREEINRKSKGQVCWLPRRMYENYLLHPESIAYILNEDDAEREVEVTITDVEGWISQQATDPKYFDCQAPNLTYPSNDWENTVHAAKLLDDLFGELTNQRVTYHKVRHGLRLTEFLISRPTPAIRELGEFLTSVLNQH